MNNADTSDSEAEDDLKIPRRIRAKKPYLKRNEGSYYTNSVKPQKHYLARTGYSDSEDEMYIESPPRNQDDNIKLEQIDVSDVGEEKLSNFDQDQIDETNIYKSEICLNQDDFKAEGLVMPVDVDEKNCTKFFVKNENPEPPIDYYTDNHFNSCLDSMRTGNGLVQEVDVSPAEDYEGSMITIKEEPLEIYNELNQCY